MRDGRLQQRGQAPVSHLHQAGHPGLVLLLTGSRPPRAPPPPGPASSPTGLRVARASGAGRRLSRERKLTRGGFGPHTGAGEGGQVVGRWGRAGSGGPRPPLEPGSGLDAAGRAPGASLRCLCHPGRRRKRARRGLGVAAGSSRGELVPASCLSCFTTVL